METSKGLDIFIKKYSLSLNQLSIFSLREISTFHNVLGWPKCSFGFSISYGKTRANFLANPIL